MSRWLLPLAVLWTLVLGGCRAERVEPAWRPPAKETVDYSRPLPPGALALRRLPPEQYPDFGPAFNDRAALAEATNHSLAYLSRPSSQRYYPYGEISHARAVASLRAFLDVLAAADSPEQFDALLRQRFDVYQSVGYDDRGSVHFTGYYTPIFEGRKRPDARFRYPLYELPPELVKDDEGRTLGRRLPDGRVVPCWTRRDIERDGVLAGHEIAYLADPFEAYVATVQGSVKLRLADGQLWELGYAGNNGHEYRSVGRLLVESGAIGRNELSLGRMMEYFRAHPEQVPRYTWQNPRTVFFKPVSGGPFGSLNVPVTARRTIATDKQVFPRAALALVVAELPARLGERIVEVPQTFFALDQDTGGAIRAAGRCDVYYGVGESAAELAGRVASDGRLYYLFVK